MGLSQKIVLESGLPVDSAYIRVDTVSGYKKEITFSVNAYVSREAFLNGYGYLTQTVYNFNPSVEVGSENFIKQAYEHLKTLPEYAIAVNVPVDGKPD